MKTKLYSLCAATILVATCTITNAQTWREKNTGFPSSFNAKSVYGEGAMTLVANNSPSSGSQMYYTPDTSTAYTGSASSLGSFAAMETKVVKCNGKHFVGGIGGIYKSTDNGVTWTITGPSSNQYTYCLYAYNDTLYAGMGNTSTLPYYSTDDGANWTLIPGYTGTQILKMLKHNGVLYIGGSSSFLYTSDMGTNWHTVSTPATLSGQNINGLELFQGGVYASCINGVFRTTDDGANWTNMTTTQMNCMTAVDTSLLCGTATNGVYRSNQAATVWTQISGGLPIYISTLYSTVTDITTNDQFAIAAVANGNGTYVIRLGDLGLTPAPTAINHVAVQNSGVEIMPVPAYDKATVHFTSSIDGEVTITIIDIQGRTVKVLTAANTSSLTLDVADLQAGMYFVKAINKGNVWIKKIEVLH